jgi:hypothetical protein
LGIYFFPGNIYSQMQRLGKINTNEIRGRCQGRDPFSRRLCVLREFLIRHINFELGSLRSPLE